MKIPFEFIFVLYIFQYTYSYSDANYNQVMRILEENKINSTIIYSKNVKEKENALGKHQLIRLLRLT